MNSDEKLIVLKENLAAMRSLALGYSGGVDSTFLMAVANEVLGDRFIDRCYLCKSQLFNRIWEIAGERGIEHIADGSNLDDLGDYRPGLIALQELNVSSPLMEAGMGKSDIRQLSRDMGLTTWNKPAAACLASRFPFGQRIDRGQLARVEKAEDLLCDLGFKQVRVRVHSDLARIEVAPEERSKFINEVLMDQINAEFKDLGFRYITLDLQGYRSGSLNPTTESKV